MLVNIMKAIIALCLIAFSTAAPFLPYKSIIGENCNPSLTGFTVTGLTVSPWPPQKGGEFTVGLTGTFNVDATLTGTAATIYESGVPLTEIDGEASGSYKAGDSYSENFTQDVPSFLPSGSYTVEMSLLNENKKPLGCWAVDFSL